MALESRIWNNKKPGWQIGFRGVSERFDPSRMVNSIENGITKKKGSLQMSQNFCSSHFENAQMAT